MNLSTNSRISTALKVFWTVAETWLVRFRGLAKHTFYFHLTPNPPARASSSESPIPRTDGSLSADRASTDPKDDLFGHAPFAKNLADSICRYPGSDPLVFALYGPWGSGKSTMLGYVRHYIEHQPEENRPVVVRFNPWWFSGQENLARAFLGQLQAVLPRRSEKFEKLAKLLGDFAEGVGGLIDLSGVTGGTAGTIVKFIMMTRRKPKDVPALKDEISEVLGEAKTRILVVIDDIDRLMPDETRQLFTVIKALADFPNVVYLLAFDREVAAQAIEQQCALPGERYLEKIIQVPFELPPIDRVALQKALFQRLGEVLGDIPEGAFDQAYWTNVYYDGIDALIQVPRDVVRFTNALAVTYPAVRGEVNVVDFIALEALRVFLPSLYDTIRSNPDRFSGHTPDILNAGTKRSNTEFQFHDAWRNSLPEGLCENAQSLVKHLFPKTGNSIYGSDWLKQWRRALRVCHPDIFPIYFRLAVPQGNIHRSEITALLALAGSPIEFGQALIRTKAERHPDGLSKIWALLERLADHIQDIPDEHIPTVIQALFDVGDELLDPADKLYMLGPGNILRASRPVQHLLKRVPADQRVDILKEAITSGSAIAVQAGLLRKLEDEVTNANESTETTLLSDDGVVQLKTVWLDKLHALSSENSLMDHPELSWLLDTWQSWDGEAAVRAWCERVVSTDNGLLAFLPKFLQYSFLVIGERAGHDRPRLNTRRLESYIDTAVCAKRLTELTEKGVVPAEAEDAVSQFLKEFEMLRKGKNPDGFDAFDDE